MTIEIKVPPLPESVSDATLIAWHKKVGDTVTRDENLVDLETDKVVLEVPAPSSGVLTAIAVANGTIVAAGDILATIEEGEGETVAAAPVVKADSKPQAATVTEAKAPKTSPAVRRLLDEYDLDETMVVGSGKDGRITKADVLAFLKTDDSGNVTPGDPSPAVSTDEEVVGLERVEQRVAMTRLRARIAERLVTAQQTAAMLTTFNEVDLTKVMSLRNR
ncbi:MAG: E3 binding domain-containing protein, partial [Gammaproteobacteria bacterium]|nr:E3 binding domain-containing protein [Gammaproteobacteria bacterium]